jgi:hypothetical protein
MKSMNRLTRRHFFQSTSGLFLFNTISGKSFASRIENHHPIKYRTLGRTGFKLSVLGIGAMRSSEPGVIRKALAMGINNVDTARDYMGGFNESVVAKAVKGIRQKIYITSKIKISNPKEMIKDVEKSLTVLKTDYLDILLLHALSLPEEINNDDVKMLLVKLKEQGKIRAFGFSTHRNMSALVELASSARPFYDVILTAFNFKSDHRLQKAIAKAAPKKMGIIAMKTQAGGYESKGQQGLNQHQAALKWVLSNPNITAAIPAMVTFEQLEENYQAMAFTMNSKEQHSLYKYGQRIDNELCRFCDACKGQCPHGISMPELNRCIMYADGYGDAELAQRTFRELVPFNPVEMCRECQTCKITCIHNLNTDQKVKRAIELFS